MCNLLAQLSQLAGSSFTNVLEFNFLCVPQEAEKSLKFFRGVVQGETNEKVSNEFQSIVSLISTTDEGAKVTVKDFSKFIQF